MKRITRAQLWLMKRLADRITIPHPYSDQINGIIEGGFCTRAHASHIISFLESLPMNSPLPPIPLIPSGRYARYDKYRNLHYYEVSSYRQKDKNIIHELMSTETTTEFREIPNVRAEYLLACLAKDIVPSMQRYGRNSGVCGYCFQPLTDEEKRVGIGRVCYQQMKSYEKYLAQEDNRVYTARIEKHQQKQQTTKENDRMDQKLDSIQFTSDDVYTLEIFLHYARATYSHPTCGDERFNRALDTLRRRGLVKIGEPVAPKTHGVILTDSGKKYLDMVLSTPLPVYRTIQEWYDPREVKG